MHQLCDNKVAAATSAALAVMNMNVADEQAKVDAVETGIRIARRCVLHPVTPTATPADAVAVDLSSFNSADEYRAYLLSKSKDFCQVSSLWKLYGFEGSCCMPST